MNLDSCLIRLFVVCTRDFYFNNTNNQNIFYMTALDNFIRYAKTYNWFNNKKTLTSAKWGIFKLVTKSTTQYTSIEK